MAPSENCCLIGNLFLDKNLHDNLDSIFVNNSKDILLN